MGEEVEGEEDEGEPERLRSFQGDGGPQAEGQDGGRQDGLHVNLMNAFFAVLGGRAASVLEGVPVRASHCNFLV